MNNKLHPKNNNILPFEGFARYSAFNQDLNLKNLSAIERIKWAHQQHGHGLVLTSSFGVQSIVMLDLVRKAGIEVPVIALDIAGDKYDTQRIYRDYLKAKMDLDLYIFPVEDEAQKVGVLKKALDQMDVRASLTGIRSAQTRIRQQKSLLERGNTGELRVHPILDWSNSDVDQYIQGLSPDLRHPLYAPDARSMGGVMLDKGTPKLECGIHLPG